jgi:hypothetical protein
MSSNINRSGSNTGTSSSLDENWNSKSRFQFQATSKTQSIPVPNRTHMDSKHFARQAEATSLADYRDFLFFSRLVGGMERQQARRHCDDLKVENDKCLTSIISTRCEEDFTSCANDAYLDERMHQQKPGRQPSPAEPSPYTSEQTLDESDEEDLIFQLEL